MGYVFRSNSDDDDDKDNEVVIVTLKIPKKYHKDGLAVSKSLDFKSFDEYVSHALMQDIDAEVEGNNTELSHILKEMK
jgi:hypothetical protein